MFPGSPENVGFCPLLVRLISSFTFLALAASLSLSRVLMTSSFMVLQLFSAALIRLISVRLKAFSFLIFSRSNLILIAAMSFLYALYSVAFFMCVFRTSEERAAISS